jgi:hypothetical protein
MLLVPVKEGAVTFKTNHVDSILSHINHLDGVPVIKAWN